MAEAKKLSNESSRKDAVVSNRWTRVELAELARDWLKAPPSRALRRFRSDDIFGHDELVVHGVDPPADKNPARTLKIALYSGRAGYVSFQNISND